MKLKLLLLAVLIVVATATTLITQGASYPRSERPYGLKDCCKVVTENYGIPFTVNKTHTDQMGKQPDRTTYSIIGFLGNFIIYLMGYSLLAFITHKLFLSKKDNPSQKG